MLPSHSETVNIGRGPRYRAPLGGFGGRPDRLIVPYGPGDENRTRSCWMGTSCATITPRPGGPPSRSRTGITWVEARSSAVELWTHLKILPLSIELWEVAQAFPAWTTVPLFPFQPDCHAARCSAPQLRALAPGSPPMVTRVPITGPPLLTGVVGTTKKTPALFRARGFQFSVLATCHPRARIPSAWWLESRRDWARRDTNRRNPGTADGVSPLPRLAACWVLSSTVG